MTWLNDVLQNDPDPNETREWLESLKAVLDHDGAERAHVLLERMVELGFCERFEHERSR